MLVWKLIVFDFLVPSYSDICSFTNNLSLLHVFHAPSYCSFINNLTLLHVFHAPPYCSFATNLTTWFTKNILNTKYRTSSLQVRGCCSLGNCEQVCTAMNRKFFLCYSKILVCTCVKISRWERRIIVIHRRTNFFYLMLGTVIICH
jgi:hypothetical protein